MTLNIFFSYLSFHSWGDFIHRRGEKTCQRSAEVETRKQVFWLPGKGISTGECGLQETPMLSNEWKFYEEILKFKISTTF